MKEYQSYSTEELYEIVWDWYKEVNGIRPRWVNSNDRQFFLSFIEYELRPEVKEERAAQYLREEEQLKWQQDKFDREMDEHYAALDEEVNWNNSLYMQYLNMAINAGIRTGE